jgi:hypothetical protein
VAQSARLNINLRACNPNLKPARTWNGRVLELGTLLAHFSKAADQLGSWRGEGCPALLPLAVQSQPRSGTLGCFPVGLDWLLPGCSCAGLAGRSLCCPCCPCCPALPFSASPPCGSWPGLPLALLLTTIANAFNRPSPLHSTSPPNFSSPPHSSSTSSCSNIAITKTHLTPRHARCRTLATTVLAEISAYYPIQQPGLLRIDSTRPACACACALSSRKNCDSSPAHVPPSHSTQLSCPALCRTLESPREK